jgi:hypothetical protein
LGRQAHSTNTYVINKERGQHFSNWDSPKRNNKYKGQHDPNLFFLKKLAKTAPNLLWVPTISSPVLASSVLGVEKIIVNG